MPELVNQIMIWISMNRIWKTISNTFVCVRKLVETASPIPQRKADGGRDDCVSLA